MQSLAQLGITALNYKAGTYTATDGSLHQMSTLNLEASTFGTSYTPVKDGVQLATTDGHLSMEVTQVHVLAAAQVTFAPPPPPPPPPGGGTPPPPPPPAPVLTYASLEGFQTQENVPAHITSAYLLGNDNVSDNSTLSVGGAFNARHGQVSFNPNDGSVIFTPDNFYYGTDAGFDYTVNAADGLTATAHVNVTVTQFTGPPPQVTGNTFDAMPLYGYLLEQVL